MKLDSRSSHIEHLRILMLFTSILFFSACGQPQNGELQATPTTTSAELVDDAEQIVDADPESATEASESISTTVSLPLLQLELPPNWTAMLLDPEEALALPVADRDAVMALSAERAVSETSGAAPTLLAIQYPRHGLSLEDYLIGVEASLRQRVEIERAGILYDLREDGKPVGIIEYGNDTVGGYQIVQFDALAENLILLTFTAPSAEIDAYMPEFNQIAAAIAVP